MALRNRWTGMGRLTKDPEVRYSDKQDGTQTCVARFSVAIDRGFKKDSKTDYISCVAFGKQGEFVEKYLKKGMKIVASGRIQTGSYKNKDGNTIYTTDVVTEEIEFAESKGSNQQEPPASDGDGYMEIPEGIENDLPFL
jgi:single-strand DNA-binding protein